VEIKANGFDDIMGLQQGLRWDVNSLEFVDFEVTPVLQWSFNRDFATGGDLIVMGYQIQEGMDYDDGLVLYTVTFNALQDLSSLTGILDFSEEMLSSQTVYRAEDDWLYITESEEAIITSAPTIQHLQTFEVSPNPVKDEAIILSAWQINAQNFQQPISLANFPAGTYSLSLRTNEGVMSKKIIKF